MFTGPLISATGYRSENPIPHPITFSFINSRSHHSGHQVRTARITAILGAAIAALPSMAEGLKTADEIIISICLPSAADGLVRVSMGRVGRASVNDAERNGQKNLTITG